MASETGVARFKSTTGDIEVNVTGSALSTYVPSNAKDEWTYTIVDLSTNSTTVSATPAVLGNIWVNVVLSAHACPIQDNATTVYSLPASAPVTTTEATGFQFLRGTIFATSLIVNPDDAATGTIVVQWRAYV